MSIDFSYASYLSFTYSAFPTSCSDCSGFKYESSNRRVLKILFNKPFTVSSIRSRKSSRNALYLVSNTSRTDFISLLPQIDQVLISVFYNDVLLPLIGKLPMTFHHK